MPNIHMIPEEAKKLFLDKYASIGDEKFYKFLLNYAINKVVANQEEPAKSNKGQRGKFQPKGISPEMELMDYYDKFLVLYRREGDIAYLEVAKIFRKASHKIYRMLLKKNAISMNNRFLNAVA